MIELPVSTRFYIGDKLIEVVESLKEKRIYCEDCFFYKVVEEDYDDYNLCGRLLCSKYFRKDKKGVIFKEVEE